MIHRKPRLFNVRNLLAQQYFCLVVAFSSLGPVGLATAGDWPQFRGSHSNGVAESSHPNRWTVSENVAWAISLKGEGWSSPVVGGDQVFLTEAVPVGLATESAVSKPEEYRGGGGTRRDDLTEVSYQWQVVSLDAQTGSELWRQTAREGRPALPRHSSNSYATETPITDGKRVYAYFGMMGVYCYNVSGNLIWKKDLGNYPMRAGWGTASSPILFDEKLFLQIDNEQQSFLVALDAATGDEIWKVQRDEKSQYSSPIIWQNGQRNELIAGGMVYRSYDPDTGNLLWQLDMQKGRSSATPLAQGDRLYVGTEFRDRGGADDGGGFLFAIKPGGGGELSIDDGSRESEFVLWQLAGSGIQMASPVLCQGHLYLLERRSGIVHCIDASTGEKVYKKRIAGARAFWASPWVQDGKVFCVDTGGTTFVLAGGPSFNVIGQNEIDEMTWSTPAVSNDALYFRTAGRLFCIKTP
ncbi:MAG: PQQ-binding-like beta-propeller repeat protein [Pirellulaceae bacterium]|nr:PQQ-binding-like beta-propeller repeat protein [Pirellulaceae bacterium]